MSYEPTIIVLKKDLDKHKTLILEGDWQYQGTKAYKKDEKSRGGENKETVMEYIQKAYTKYAVIKIGGIELIIMNPCLTSFNAAVRNKLTELKVEFELD